MVYVFELVFLFTKKKEKISGEILHNYAIYTGIPRRNCGLSITVSKLVTFLH